jgi:hypothetical protein
MNNKYFSAARSVLQTLSAGFASLCFISQAYGLQQHQQIQGPFATPREVTVKCLECHPQQADEVLNSIHWTWTRQAVINGESIRFRKTDSLAGFAIDVSSNAPRCMACHISNDRGSSLQSPSPDAVDCLVCHDTTGRYLPPVPFSVRVENPSDLTVIARNVGSPTPANCGACHFADCGLAPSEPQNSGAGAADIHLSAAGGNFSCQTCHAGNGGGHAFSRLQDRPGESSPSGRGCASCHSGAPHDMDILNRHGERIACRTCHIPAAGRGTPVLIGWNWIMSGKTVPVHQSGPGFRLQIHDRNGLRRAADIDPIYLWDDGSDTVYMRGQRIQPEELTILQGPAKKNDRSKIAPFRIIYGTQLYDRKYRYLISPLLQPEGSGLFPAVPESLAGEGMKAVVLPYSGQYGYTATAIYKKISHGVAPAGQALGCLDCHGRSGLMNWPALGYDADPWSNDLTMQPAADVSGSVSNPGPTPSAADEWDIPAGSD